MKKILTNWKNDKLNTALWCAWLATVFFCFLGSKVLLVKIPGLPALYPFRVLLPLTTLLYLAQVIRHKRNPWKEASAIQRVCYVLCAILLVYSTASLGWAMDYEYSFTLWITLCFDLVFFALTMDLCREKAFFADTVRCALIALLLQIAMGIKEVTSGGIFDRRFDGNHNFPFWGFDFQHPVVAAGNPNDFVMLLIFTLALFLLYWTWKGHEEKLFWLPVVLIGPIYFLIRAAGGRLCELAFWILMAGFALRVLTLEKRKYWMIPVSILMTVLVIFGCNHDPQREETLRSPKPAAVQIDWRSFSQTIRQPASQTTPQITCLTASQTNLQTAAKVSLRGETSKKNVPSKEPLMNEFFVVDEETGELQLNLALSGGTRVELLLRAWECFAGSKGMGVGLGNTAQYAKLDAGPRGDVWAIHCFIARMAADFGIWFLIPFLLIAFMMLHEGVKHVRRGLKTRNWGSTATGIVYLAAIVVYPIASTAAGDAQNCLPMWLFLGAIAVYPAYLQITEEN